MFDTLIAGLLRGNVYALGAVGISLVFGVMNVVNFAQFSFFGLGAMLASILWFTVIGFGARYLAPLFAKPVTWRVLDIGVGVLMIVLGIKLVLG